MTATYYKNFKIFQTVHNMKDIHKLNWYTQINCIFSQSLPYFFRTSDATTSQAFLLLLLASLLQLCNFAIFLKFRNLKENKTMSFLSILCPICRKK